MKMIEFFIPRDSSLIAPGKQSQRAANRFFPVTRYAFDFILRLGASNRTIAMQKDWLMATTDDLSDGTKDAGSAIIAQSFGIGTADCSSFAGFLDSTGFLVMVHVLKPVTATGVMFVQTQQGSYTADNYNGIGLYSFSSPILTLTASSPNDGMLWKQASPSLKKQPFSSSVALQAGYTGFVRCITAVRKRSRPRLPAHQPCQPVSCVR